MQKRRHLVVPGLGFCVIYRARIHSDKEARYVAAWSRLTELLRRNHGALGSRLHRGDDGIWYAYAQWASAEARTAAFAHRPIDAEAEQTVRECVAEYFPEIQLEPVEDQLVPVRDIVAT
jgi:quinol monooxygenase YgiN